MAIGVFAAVAGRSFELTAVCLLAPIQVLANQQKMMQQLSDDLASGRKKARSRVAVAYDEIDRFLNPQVPEEVAPADVPSTSASQQSPDIVTW